MAASQRVPSSAGSYRIHAAWHEAAGGTPTRLMALTTGVEGAAVIRASCPRLSSLTHAGMSAAHGWNGAIDPMRTSASPISLPAR